MSKATGAELSRQSQELTIFHDVAKALTSSLDLDSILQTIMDKMAEYFRPETWSLLMLDHERNELYFAIAVGAASESLKDVRLKVGEGIAGHVAKHGETLIVPVVAGATETVFTTMLRAGPPAPKRSSKVAPGRAERSAESAVAANRESNVGSKLARRTRGASASRAASP